MPPVTQVAFMEVGDWDTHVNQRGRLNRNLGLLGEGLATLKEGLGSVYENTTVVVLSEFGRTIAENGNGGTEHGYGNAMWLMGGRVKGGELYGDWPGLAPANQHESRDLMVTTDYRDVMTAVLAQQFGLDGDAIARIFPNYQQQVNLSLIA
ncbi:MAG: DUF1501 domain-containing protein [Cyanobacteria bacterium J06643_4]